jgi:hypothetical protein
LATILNCYSTALNLSQSASNPIAASSIAIRWVRSLPRTRFVVQAQGNIAANYARGIDFETNYSMDSAFSA